MGISRDDVPTQARFVAAESLNFPLLADADGTLARRWCTEASDGATTVTRRVTILVGPDGKIRAIDEDVQFRTNATSNGQARESLHGENLRLLLSDWRAATVGDPVPRVSLPDVRTGQSVLLCPSDALASVIVLRNGPVAVVANAREETWQTIEPLLDRPAVYGRVAFRLLFTGPTQSPASSTMAEAFGAKLRAAIAAHPNLTGTVPHLWDPFGEVAPRFFAPEGAANGADRRGSDSIIVVVDARGRVAYRGAGTHLRLALDAVLRGRAVPLLPVVAAL